MRLFPESEQWVCNTLINPTTNEINHVWIVVINHVITCNTKNVLNDYTYKEFVNLLNSILSGQQLQNEEISDFKEVVFRNSFTRMFGMSYNNDYDLCGILLIIKKIIDENLTTCVNPIDFISDAIILLNPVTHILDEDFGLFLTYFPKNFTYSDIEDDKFMNDFFENDFFEFGPVTISNIINNGEYSFLLLNENFKRRIYGAIDEDIFNELISNYQVYENFIRTLLKYQPMALRFIGDSWNNNQEIVILAVSNNGLALEFAPNEFKSDREIVILAVSNNGLALEFVPKEFKSDREIVILAVKNNPNSLIFASDEIIVAAANSIIDGIV